MTNTSKGYTMRRLSSLALAGVLGVGALACAKDYLDVPNYNSPTVDAMGKDPNGIQLLATGIMRSERDQAAGWNRDVGIFGREVYNYFTTDGRTVSAYLVGIPGPQRLDYGGFASGQWNGRFQGMKNAIALIDAVNASSLNAAQKAAVQGFAKTWRAYDLFKVVQTRDTLGSPVDIPSDPTQPAPFKTRDEVFAFISSLLDEAKTNLVAGGAAFPFTMHSGFAGFNTPATFLKFNRAIAAKVLVQRGSLGCASCYAQALTALGESYATAPGAAASLADLNIGPLHVYSTAAGDVSNGNSFAVNNYVYAHSEAVDIAQLQPDGVTPDDRVVRKLVKLDAPVSPPGAQNIAAEYRFQLYPDDASPAPILRNEELLLLRAEANWATGQLGAALTDLNTVRTISGKLAPLAAVPAGDAGLDLIMYEKHESLLFEGSRWVDMRRWGRLSQLPIDRAGQFVAKVMPIPQAECDGRVTKPRGCEGNL